MIFGISAPTDPDDPSANLLAVGSLPIDAGLQLNVVLLVTAPDRRDLPSLPELGLGEIGGIAFTPLSPLHALQTERWSQVALVDALVVDDQGSLAASEKGLNLLALARADASARFAPTDGAVWRLPADAIWGELLFEFTAEEVVNVRFRGQTRRLEPEHLGMKDGRTSRPTHQWALLKTFGTLSGTITPKRTREHAKLVKHKQELSKSLRLHFGLRDDPIRHDKRAHAYITEFIIRSVIPARIMDAE
ncbi:hypothetical protein [Bauldia litoralis]|uniref:hypothetical protein n=1 Tax=Bauldia litoralis TaxID=665467 RepID=UPI000B894C79|nr:hypothetical protein [Bauldia litoralis]